MLLHEDTRFTHQDRRSPPILRKQYKIKTSNKLLWVNNKIWVISSGDKLIWLLRDGESVTQWALWSHGLSQGRWAPSWKEKLCHIWSKTCVLQPSSDRRLAEGTWRDWKEQPLECLSWFWRWTLGLCHQVASKIPLLHALIQEGMSWQAEAVAFESCTERIKQE